MSDKALRPRSPSEVLKRGYSDEELGHIYALARFCLENGDTRRAETILFGINEVAPDFGLAWLGTCTIHSMNKNNEAALSAAKQALRTDPESIEAMLFLVCCLLTAKDFNAAGSYLGEIGERIDAGMVESPNLLRFYQAQLARYQNR
jgi:hypothetical protein